MKSFVSISMWLYYLNLVYLCNVSCTHPHVFHCSLQTNNNLRMEPKFIVFLTQILALFKFCHFCTAANPTTEASHCGTMLTIRSTCIYPTCMKEYIWRSQPTIPGTQISAGNFLLNMATLLAGGSISKVLQICKHMGLRTVSLVTFFKHQKVCNLLIFLVVKKHKWKIQKWKLHKVIFSLMAC